MILWFVLTVMTSIAAVFVSTPFIRRLERRQRAASSVVAVYRDQLKEVDNEAALGLIDGAHAETARTEIKRRLLVAGETEESALPALSSGERTFAAIGVAGVVVLGSIGLFALTANLEQLTETPVAAFERPTAKPVDRPAVNTAEASAPPVASNAPPDAGQGKTRARSPIPPVEEMIQRLVTRLQRNPKDVEGWRMLGWSYSSTDHFTEAAAAYARAIELNPDSADYRDARAEALIRAANGVVTPEAKSSVEETLEHHPKDARARYLKGLAIEQAGDKATALKEWNDLLGELEPNEPLARELKRRIAGDGKDSDQSRAGPPRAASDAVTANVEVSKLAGPTPDKGPRPDDIRNAEAMPPADRAAMIRRMVDSLANRLEQSPNDVDGWIKLIRSRSVLGDRDKAKLALEKALKVFADESAERKRVTETAEELGLNR